MNAKKITALVLAAMMAVGTSVTAFAEIDVSNPGKGLDADRPLAFEDENVYVDRDGILVKNPDEYRPGDTIYIRLSEYTADKSKGEKDSKIEDEKERTNVYADWNAGKDAVEDIDLAYDKGEFQSSSNFAGWTYTLQSSNADLKGDFYVAGDHKDLAEVKDALRNSDKMTAALENAEVVSGYTVDGKYYANASNAISAEFASEYSKVGERYLVDGKFYEWGDATEVLSDLGYKAIGTAGLPATVYHDATEWIAGFGTFKTESDPDHSTSNPSATAFGTCYVRQVDDSTWEYVNLNPNSELYNASVSTVTVTNLVDKNVIDGERTDDAYQNTAGDTFFDAEAVMDYEAKTRVNGPKVVNAVTSTLPVWSVGGKTYDDIEKAKDALLDEVTVILDAQKTGADTGYTYWVKIDTVEDDTTKVVDLAGILYVGRTRNKAEDADNAFHLDAPLSNRVNDSTNYVTVDDEYTFKPDSRSVVKFDKDADDVVLYFGENEDAWFEVDARGQSALNLEFTFDFNREIADLFPKANIDFLTFTSEPSFNRTGTLYIVADADSFIYEVTENGVKEIANAEYDEDEEAWVIRTRKLAAYAISDRELDTSITLDGEDNTTSVDADGNKQNPDTGR